MTVPRYSTEKHAVAPLNGLSTPPWNRHCGFELMKIGTGDARRVPKSATSSPHDGRAKGSLVVTAQGAQNALRFDERRMHDVRATAIFAKSASKCITSVDNAVTAA